MIVRQWKNGGDASKRRTSRMTEVERTELQRQVRELSERVAELSQLVQRVTEPCTSAKPKARKAALAKGAK